MSWWRRLDAAHREAVLVALSVIVVGAALLVLVW
jgi:hypothetical protein